MLARHIFPELQRLLAEFPVVTIHRSQLRAVRKMAALSPNIAHACLVYAGDFMAFSDGMKALPYDRLHTVL